MIHQIAGLRSERKALSVTVHSTAEFPKQPTEEAVNDANIRYSTSII